MRLIEVLNKIANGELKEGTKVKWDIFEYTYKKGDCYDEYLERKVDKFNYVDIIDDMALRHLNTEVELIEPYHFTDVGKMAEHIREDTKMIEPTDNTKIEELDVNALTWNDLLDYQKLEILFDKLNEVIRKLNWAER